MRTQIKTKTWENVRRTARRILPAVGLLSLGVIGALHPQGNVNAASEAWGPERTTYTWEEPAPAPVFNSITNNPGIGDERNFVRIRKAGETGPHLDEVNLEVGQEYEVYIYYHNNAASNLNASGKGMAQNVRVAIEAPEVVHAGKSAEIKGIISSTNTTPATVWDVAYAHSDSTVYLHYVPNSAVLHNEGSANGSVLSSEALFSEAGSKIAHSDKYWGYIPGCNEYAGYITYRFVVDQPAFDMSKTVSKDQANDYQEKLTVAPGDVLDFKITYKNTGTMDQQSVKFFDEMPAGLNYVEGSSYMITPVNGTGNFVSDSLFDKNAGLNIGDYHPGDEVTVTYKVEVAGDDAFKCGETYLYNNAIVATANGTGYDKVLVTVNRTNNCVPDQPELPHTGPGEIALAVVIVATIATGTAYYFSSRKQLKELESGSDK